jgi:hypothetical protein
MEYPSRKVIVLNSPVRQHLPAGASTFAEPTI